MASALQTLQNVYDDVRYRTGTGTTSSDTGVVSDATLLRIANKYFFKMVGAVVETNEDIYAEIGTFNLVANQREYTIPTDETTSTFAGGAVNWQVLRVELKLDGTNWRVARPLDRTNISSPENESDITSRFSNADPAYTAFDNSIFIYSGTISAVTTGGRIFYIKRPSEITAGTDVLSSAVYMMGKEFYDILSIGMSGDIYERFGQLTQKENALGHFNEGLELMKKQLTRRQGDRDLIFKSRFINYR